MSKSRILIVAGDTMIGRGYQTQLSSIFGDEVEIQYLTLKDEPEFFLGFDLILAASQAIHDDVRRKAPLNARIITVIRNLNTMELQKLFNIEPGSHTLVVSNYYHAAKETVSLLTELGLNHLIYYAYSPGTVLDPEVEQSIDLAITAGAAAFVPPFVKKVVDLGLKIIDISTIVEIIINLDLPLERINHFTLRYMKEFINLNKEITDLKYRLETVLDASSNGIIALDREEKIVFMNKNSEIFLHPKRSMKVGDIFTTHLKNTYLGHFLRDFGRKESEVFKIDDKDVMVSKTYLKEDEKITGTVLSLSFVSEIQNMEKEIRKKLNTKGNVAKYDFADIIGTSPAIHLATDMTRKAAKTDLSVLLLGENGTGKELFAQAIHKNSFRCDGAFVAVNFAALPESLIESELFGYEEGAFTGAKKGGKIGLFELAHHGTIFLDEIGDAPLSLQARLLRVIQEKEVLRVGGVSPIPVDVRVIAATNRDLKEMIRTNQFRKDLYYRLNVITIRIPSLRERKEDIPNIIDYYMDSLSARKTFSPQATAKLTRYDWPGNVRELQNLIHYVVEISDSQEIQVHDLPPDLRDDLERIPVVSGEREDRWEDRWEDQKKAPARQSHALPDSRIIRMILEELSQAEESYQRASRAYLVDRLCRRGIPVTDNILRRIMKELADLDFVTIGSTKQGTRITPAGRVWLEENSPS